MFWEWEKGSLSLALRCCVHLLFTSSMSPVYSPSFLASTTFLCESSQGRRTSPPSGCCHFNSCYFFLRRLGSYHSIPLAKVPRVPNSSRRCHLSLAFLTSLVTDGAADSDGCGGVGWGAAFSSLHMCCGFVAYIWTGRLTANSAFCFDEMC